ncbi:alpha/beta hydrolase, partial [Staphylococcus arlettae]|uniref:serine aminopeptidase domain-containing protein n=2 Tax=Bacteria TaxID=2 RepID=UPI003CE8DD92
SDTLYGLVGLMERAWSSIGKVRAPTLYLYGYNDEVIPKTATFEAARRLKPDDRSGYYRDGWHLLLVDKQAERVWKDVEGFIRDPAAPLVS